jgi:hypothetical protein
LLLGVGAALPASFLCPIPIAWVYVLWSFAGIGSGAIVILFILPPPKDMGNAGEIGNTGTGGGSAGAQIAEYPSPPAVAPEGDLSAPADVQESIPQVDAKISPGLVDAQTQVPGALDMHVAFECVKKAGELLPISPEMEAKISALKLPLRDTVPDNVLEIWDFFEIRNDEDLHRVVRYAFQIPIIQGPNGNCFAASHMIRWQRDNHDIFFTMCVNIFLKGRCRMYNLFSPFFIYANLSILHKIPGELLLSAFTNSYEHRPHCMSQPVNGQIERVFNALRNLDCNFRDAIDLSDEGAELDGEFRELVPLIPEYKKYMREHASVLIQSEFPPFDSALVREVLHDEVGVTYHHNTRSSRNQVIIAGDRFRDSDFCAKVALCYTITDYIMEQFIRDRERLSWDEKRGGFRPSTPFGDILKRCGFPSNLRKFTMKWLQTSVKSKCSKNDLVMGGSALGACLTFPAMAEKDHSVRIHDTRDIPAFLERLIEVAVKWDVPPGGFIPAFSPGHAANLVAPGVRSVAEIQDRQSIPLVCTNCAPGIDIYVRKQGDEFIYFNPALFPKEILKTARKIIQGPEDDPMRKGKFTEFQLCDPRCMVPYFKPYAPVHE